MTLADIFQSIGVLLLVLAAMGAFALAIKKSGFAGAIATAPAKKRLRILESLALDPRRRAVLIACDDKAHLLILSSHGDVLVKSDLPLEASISLAATLQETDNASAKRKAA